MRPRRVHAPIVATACVLTLGCASGPPGSGPGHGIGGLYEGSIAVQGQPFSARVTLRSRGTRELRGAVRLGPPIDLEGDVRGVVVDDLLRIEIAYRSPSGCDGRIEGILDVTRAGDALDGPVTVRDCEEPVAGTMTLRRRVERRPSAPNR